MARTSPDLLTEILGVLGQINTKIGASGTPEGSPTKESKESKESMATKGLGLNMGKISKDAKESEKLKNTAVALKDLSSSLIPLSKGLIRFSMVPAFAKKRLRDFMESMLMLGSHKQAVQAKLSAESMKILGDALPKLAKGVFRFGIMQKIGLVTATSIGLRSLLGALMFAANPIVLIGAAAVTAVGVALHGIAGILSGIAKVILAFAGAVVIMVGAIYMASKLFKVGPIAAMGIIVGSIAILAGGIALIGLLGVPIAIGGIAIGKMGKGLLWLSGALLALTGAIALMNMITGNEISKSLTSIIKPVMYLALMMVGIGLLSMFIIMGGIGVKEMGKGFLWISGGLIALGGVYYLLTKVMGLDMFDMGVNVAATIGILGLMFAGLGLSSILIIPGTSMLLGIGISIAIFALISLGIGLIIKKLGGKEGIETISENISDLIGCVLSGVITGVKKGLLGDSKSTGVLKYVDVAKNVAILIASVDLLMGVSVALMMFAFSLKAFTSAGIIKTVTGYKKNGDPIYGESINVVDIATNIANSIGSFFTTLVKTFEDPKIIPSARKMMVISQLLMGVKGPKLLGIRIFSLEVPGIVDALSKFAELISLFARVNQIPIYDVDKNGRPIVKSYITPGEVATNIVTTLLLFFKTFSDKENDFKSISTKSTHTLAQVLLGKQAFKIFGLKFGRDRIGLLEPIMKFSDVLVQYAKFGTTNELPYEFDEKGKVIKSVNVKDIGNNIVMGISTFMNSLSTAFTPEKINALGDKSKGLNKVLEHFDTFIDKFDKLGNSVEKIDKFGDSVGKLASNIGLLVENMGQLNTNNLDKLTTSLIKYVDSPPRKSTSLPEYVDSPVGKSNLPIAHSSAVSSKQSGSASMSNENMDLLAQKIGEVIAAKLSGFGNGEFNFNFYDQGSGVLQIKNK